MGSTIVPINRVSQLIDETVNINWYRQVKAQVIYNKDRKPDHILVFLFARNYHGFKILRINIDSNYRYISSIQNYQLQKQDIEQRPGLQHYVVVCPDTSVQFISFAPNDITPYRDDQKYAIQVDQAAKAAGLKTALLLGDKVTAANWLNYMSCPKLEGNFYDGDASLSSVSTHDGYLYYDDFSVALKGKHRLKVTNIWLACLAFNDPMKSSVIDDALAQKYAAGISDLLCGPSDQTAVCTVEDAIKGQGITNSFNTCYKKYDDPSDKWGLGGNGSDYFGK